MRNWGCEKTNGQHVNGCKDADAASAARGRDLSLIAPCGVMCRRAAEINCSCNGVKVHDIAASYAFPL
jgi:hypothetical protein